MESFVGTYKYVIVAIVLWLGTGLAESTEQDFSEQTSYDSDSSYQEYPTEFSSFEQFISLLFQQTDSEPELPDTSNFWDPALDPPPTDPITEVIETSPVDAKCIKTKEEICKFVDGIRVCDNKYIKDVYDCEHFSRDFCIEARKRGVGCRSLSLDCHGGKGAHQMVVIEVTASAGNARRFCLVEPQTNEVIACQETTMTEEKLYPQVIAVAFRPWIKLKYAFMRNCTKDVYIFTINKDFKRTIIRGGLLHYPLIVQDHNLNAAGELVITR